LSWHDLTGLSPTRPGPIHGEEVKADPAQSLFSFT
jgi:hypothetical protein